MAQNKTKKEHYIPRAYLRSFSENGQCQLYDKSTNKSFCASVEKIFAQRYFYDIHKELLLEYENIDEQAIEKILANTVDSFLNNIVQNIDENYRWFLPKYPYHYLSVYKCLAIQLIRTPQGKQRLLELYSKVYKKNIDKELENVILMKEISKILDDMKLQSLLVENLLTEYGHICVGINNSDIHFISSDNPIIIIPNIWDEQKIEDMIFYPITPHRCLFFHKMKKVESQLKSVLNEFSLGKLQSTDLTDIPKEAYNREKEKMNILNPPTRNLTRADVLVLNTCLYKMASKYIVYKHKADKQELWLKNM